MAPSKTGVDAELSALRARLRAERESRDVTFAQVAKVTVNPNTGRPVVRSAVEKWETGENALPLYALYGYSRALDLPIQVLVGMELPLPATLARDRAHVVQRVVEFLIRAPQPLADTLAAVVEGLRLQAQQLPALQDIRERSDDDLRRDDAS